MQSIKFKSSLCYKKRNEEIAPFQKNELIIQRNVHYDVGEAASYSVHNNTVLLDKSKYACRCLKRKTLR